MKRGSVQQFWSRSNRRFQRRCIYCGQLRSRVISSWIAGRGFIRLRECRSCEGRFQTVERLDAYWIKKRRQRRSEEEGAE